MKKITLVVVLVLVSIFGTTLAVNKLNDKDAQLAELRVEIESLNSTVEYLKNSREDILRLIDEIEKNIIADKAHIETLLVNKDANIDKIDSLSRNVALLESTLKGLKEELRAKNDIILSLEGKVTELWSNLDASNVTIAKLKSQISAAKALLAKEQADRTEDLTAIYDRLIKLQEDYFRN